MAALADPADALLYREYPVAAKKKKKKKKRARSSGGPAPQTAAFLARVLRPRAGVKKAGLLRRAIGGDYDLGEGGRGRRRGGGDTKGRKKTGPRFLLLQNPLPRRGAERPRRKRKRWAHVPAATSAGKSKTQSGNKRSKKRSKAAAAKAKRQTPTTAAATTTTHGGGTK